MSGVCCSGFLFCCLGLLAPGFQGVLPHSVLPDLDSPWMELQCRCILLKLMHIFCLDKFMRILFTLLLSLIFFMELYCRCCQLDGDLKEISPVFTQFLECVWNLTEQFPQAFEYNEAFLLQIHEHVHSCQFGNFLGNCQKEREELR